MVLKNRRLAAALIVWGAVSGGGLYAVAAHGAAAGAAADAPAFLDSSLRTSGRATVVVAAHPSCPCTRATLHELDRIVASKSGDADIVILFAGTPRRDRVATDLRAAAERIPGAHVIDDPNRALAESLGAHTSGTVLFYDRQGSLKFSGGITPSRGHEGDSAGGDRIRALLAAETAVPTPVSSPVYGCSL